MSELNNFLEPVYRRKCGILCCFQFLTQLWHEVSMSTATFHTSQLELERLAQMRCLWLLSPHNNRPIRIKRIKTAFGITFPRLFGRWLALTAICSVLRLSCSCSIWDSNGLN